MSGRRNNLNLIRMVAASAVLVSHAFPISLGTGAEEPLEQLTGMSLGGLAVAVFFALSGLLISRSYDRKPTMARFVIARGLRLFPALVIALIITVISGAMLTSLDLEEYFKSSDTLTYIPRNLSLAFIQYPLPGVFTQNPYPHVVNGSLWTLFYEVLCYSAVVLVGSVGALRAGWTFVVFFTVVVISFLWGLGWEPLEGLMWRVDQLIKLGFPFALGVAAYVWRSSFLLDWRIALLTWLVWFVAFESEIRPLFFLIAIWYSVIFLAFIPKGFMLTYNRLGDYSYGVYIYAFPVQQVVASIWPSAGPYFNMTISFPAVLLLAWLSWHFVETVALSRIDWMAQKLAPARSLKSDSRADLL